MNLSKNLTYSIIAALILFAIIAFVSGGRIMGIIFMLPLSLLLRSQKRQAVETKQSPGYHTAEPIEPKY